MIARIYLSILRVNVNVVFCQKDDHEVRVECVCVTRGFIVPSFSSYSCFFFPSLIYLCVFFVCMRARFALTSAMVIIIILDTKSSFIVFSFPQFFPIESLNLTVVFFFLSLGKLILYGPVLIIIF